MGRRVPGHLSSHGEAPPPDAVFALVEKTDNHWYWLDEFYDDNVDRTPVFRWAATGYPAGRYVVARLLWCWTHPESITKRVVLENTCGLYTCVNPDHWHSLHLLRRDHAFTLPTDTTASLRSRQYNPVLLKPMHPALIHIVPEDTEYAMCGYRRLPMKHSLGTVITCKACIAGWRGYNRPLIELP